MKALKVQYRLLGFIGILLIGNDLQVMAQNGGTMNYQGRLHVQGAPFTGVGEFKFALVSPTINISRRATGSVRTSGGEIISVTVLDGGAGYVTPPRVVFNDATGQGASAIAVLSDGAVVSVTLRGGGSGYSTETVVRFEEPPENLVAQTYWSNDGTSVDGSAPAQSVLVNVEDGLFMVELGDTTLAGMTVSIPASIFSEDKLELRIWFNDSVNGWQQLAPDQSLSYTGNAMMAERVRNFSIGTDSLDSGAVTTSKLAFDAVTTHRIADGQVATSDLADFSVTTEKLANGAATAQKIANFAVGNLQLANDSVASSKVINGSITLDDLHPNVGSAFWKLNGNGGTSAGIQFLGTTDGEPFEIKVEGKTALRIEPNFFSPNLIGGVGSVSSGIQGVVIAGGGTSMNPQRVDGNYAFIGAGYSNHARGQASVIAGGMKNTIALNGRGSSIVGGEDNVIGNAGELAFVGGGLSNTNDASYAGIGSGIANATAGDFSFIGSGSNNKIASTASYSGIVSGAGNEVIGQYSMANGRRAKARHHGTFVWADHANTDFASTGNQQFLIRAAGGVGIGTSSPDGLLHVLGNGSGSNPQLLLSETTVGNRARLQMRASGLIWELTAGGGGGVSNSFDIAYGGNILTSINESGELFAKVLTITGGADLAEPFLMDEENIPKGALVIIDDQEPGRLRLSDRAYDSRVSGIVSGANGVNPGLTLRQEGVMEGNHHVALSGRVYALADASHGSIKPGDLLTTSETPGHAMVASDPSRTHGTIVGKAMSELFEGRGLVLVLVSLH